VDNSRQPDANDYQTGYGKPPVNRRFKKGQSGNPSGRPKGSKNAASVIKRALNERVTINEGGRRKTITKLEAAVKQLVNKAASGDLRVGKLFLLILQMAEQDIQETQFSVSGLDDDDQKVVNSLLERWELELNGESEK
jgi:hypothetical protein